MIKFFIIILQLTVLVLVSSFLIRNSYPVSLTLDQLIITTSSSVLFIFAAIIIFMIIFFQRIIFFFKLKIFKLKLNKQKDNWERGYQAFSQGMIAVANKDFQTAITENKKVSYYLKNTSLNLLLKSETLKIEKKYDELSLVYEEMLKIENTKAIGLKGLMKKNIYAQDYHHAFVYGESLFNINPKIEKLYDTLVNIIGKTNNWQKLIEISSNALSLKLITKDLSNVNKSIGYYEISKIKMHSEPYEAIKLIENSLKLRQFFYPYVSYYLELLIENNELIKTKKYLQKNWKNLLFPELKNIIKSLSIKLNLSFSELTKIIVSNDYDIKESKILLAESFIENQKWNDAKKILTPLLQHKPSKEVCLLMSVIEKNNSNDPQKVNAWISRSNFGELNRIWICSITNTTQENWSSMSNSGYFNSLEWRKPKDMNNLSSQDVESNIISYINN